MSSNSPRIRITVWLPNEIYHGMHSLSENNYESHTDLVIRAIRKELKAALRADMRRFPLKTISFNGNGKDAKQA